MAISTGTPLRDRAFSGGDRSELAIVDRVGSPALPPEFAEFALPAESPAALREGIARAETRKTAAETRLTSLTPSLPALQTAKE